MGTAIEHAGGQIEKFIGDGIMALFGIETGADKGSRAALLNPLQPSTALPGYNSGIDYTQLIWSIVRLVLGLYLLASALVWFDRVALSPIECLGRLILTVLVIFANPDDAMEIRAIEGSSFS